jgi:hypothetical protein
MNSKRPAKHSLATRTNFEYTVVKSDRHRMILKCLDPECGWRLHASAIVDGADPYFQIKTMSTEHTCPGVHHLGHRQATAKFIGAQIQSKINDQPAIRAKEIANDIRREKGIQMNYQQAYRAKVQALNAINGTEEDAYTALPKYCDDLKRNNPGSTIVLEFYVEESGMQHRFRRMFICYGASAVGFGFCCPVLGLDGTHLKSKYRGIIRVDFADKGVLLSAQLVSK